MANTLRERAGLGSVNIPAKAIGWTFLILWVLIGYLTRGFDLSLILAIALTVGIVITLNRTRIAGLKEGLRVRVIHYTGTDSSTPQYPERFECLVAASPAEHPLVLGTGFAGGIDIPPLKMALAFFNRDWQPIAYLALIPGHYRLNLLEDGLVELNESFLGDAFGDFLDRDAQNLATFNALGAGEQGRATIDLAKVKAQWADIVLAPDLEAHLLRAMLLFAYGDPSAPRGLLLKGPPGTGKSLVAQALATASGARLFKCSTADLKGSAIGESGNKVLQLWNDARSATPAIIFVDECEGIFVKRGSDQGDAFTNEIVQTFLIQWDGIGGHSNILVIGATNRPELMDDAINSRFTDVVDLLPAPPAQRRALVAAVARQVGYLAEIPGELMEAMSGLSGREVRNVLQQALRAAAPDFPNRTHLEAAIAKARGKGSTQTDKASWDTLVLPEDLKTRLKTLCQMVKDADALSAKGIPVPRTLLLWGPPGTGKTEIARTLANQAGLSFIAKSTADLKGQYLGHAANRIAQTFESARATSPAILFIDEIDALTGSRGGEGGDQLQTEALTQLLQELDGVGAKAGRVYVVAATNRMEDMDAAILSRFSQRIEIGLPGLMERKTLLTTLLAGRPVSAALQVDTLADYTEGYSGRDLREAVSIAFNHAVTRTLAEGKPATDTILEQEDLRLALTRG